MAIGQAVRNAGNGNRVDGAGRDRIGRDSHSSEVRRGAGAAARAPHALQKTRYRRGAVDLNHAIEVPDINAQFERARRNNDAITPLGKCPFGVTALGYRQRPMREIRFNPQTPKIPRNFFDNTSRICKHEALPSRMQHLNDFRRIRQTAHIVQDDFRLAALFGRGVTPGAESIQELNHFSFCRLCCESFGVAPLAHAIEASTIEGIWSQGG